jgi:tRNA(Ile)-lysidine synthase
MKYVVAVSGGIDSMVLLDILFKHAHAELVVAHVDHGIRDDSYRDELFVRQVADVYSLPYESTRLSVTKKDESSLRQARYAWLEQVRDKHKADAIVTAHHQDDVLETMVINHLRGTGWRGVSALRSHPKLYRPLLPMSKAGIVSYALEHAIQWRDDSTNEDVRYLRNAVRHHVVPRMSGDVTRRRLTDIHSRHVALRQEIDEELAGLMKRAQGTKGLKRYYLIMLPQEIARELLYHHSPSGLQAQHVRKLLHFARSARPGAKLRVAGNLHAVVTADELIVTTL